MKRILLLFLLCLLFLPGLSAQELVEEIAPVAAPEAGELPADRLMLAISSKNYPVTPGDVYRLTFLIAGETISNGILVESNYTINLDVFGKINAENMTFSELKPIVEKRISDAYNRSLPFLNIESVGIFQVIIKGEVPQTRFITAWGLSRLSEIVRNNLGAYSSIRRIGIIAKEGRLKEYDLYKALHLGIIEENPYIMPGDTIIVYRRDRQIEINGEIYRPNRYQILENEELKELINIYAGGFTNLADTSRVKLDRFAGEKPRTFYFDFTDSPQPSFKLEDGDILTIPAKSTRLPIVIFEGAIMPEVAVAVDIEEPGFEIYNRITYPLKEGESLFDALQAIKESIAPVANLSKAYIVRVGITETIPVNLEKLLYAYTPAADMALQPFDRIVIPAHRFYSSLVPVSGAVYTPGSYPFTPGKNYIYYVDLAGGIDPERNTDNRVSITGSQGNVRGLDGAIAPGDRIFVHTNDFVYNFNRHFPILTTGVAFIITIITIINLLVE